MIQHPDWPPTNTRSRDASASRFNHTPLRDRPAAPYMTGVQPASLPTVNSALHSAYGQSLRSTSRLAGEGSRAIGVSPYGQPVRARHPSAPKGVPVKTDRETSHESSPPSKARYSPTSSDSGNYSSSRLNQDSTESRQNFGKLTAGSLAQGSAANLRRSLSRSTNLDQDSSKENQTVHKYGTSSPLYQATPSKLRRSFSRSSNPDPLQPSFQDNVTAVAEQRLPSINGSGSSIDGKLSGLSLSAPSTRRGSHSQDELEKRRPQTPASSRISSSPIRTNPKRMHPKENLTERGLVGLTNLGNTCFMNSCLQCLLNTEDLVEWFLSEKWKTDIQKKSPMKGQIADAFADLSRQVFEARNSTSVSPAALKRVVGKWAPHFSGFNQQDSQEFMRFLLDGLNEDVRRERRKPSTAERRESSPELSIPAMSQLSWNKHLYMNDSYMTDLFCGQLLSQIKCLSCQNISHCFDPFLDLSVPIPKKSQVKEKPRQASVGMTYPLTGSSTSARCSLQDCLKSFVKEEVLDGDDKYSCEKCKMRRKGVKQMRIYRFPPYIVIHIKRFQYSQFSREKLGTSVEFPLTGLDLHEFAFHPYESKDDLPPIYDLYAVSNHMGGLGGGHYTAHCMNRMSNRWYTFNDSLVTSIDPDDISGSNAYVLFYKQQGLRLRDSMR